VEWRENDGPYGLWLRPVETIKRLCPRILPFSDVKSNKSQYRFEFTVTGTFLFGDKPISKCPMRHSRRTGIFERRLDNETALFTLSNLNFNRRNYAKMDFWNVRVHCAPPCTMFGRKKINDERIYGPLSPPFPRLRSHHNTYYHRRPVRSACVYVRNLF